MLRRNCLCWDIGGNDRRKCMAVVHSVKYGHLGLPCCGKHGKTVLRLSKVGEQQHCDWLIFIIFFDNGLLTHYRGI